MKWTNSYRSFGLKTKRSTGLKTIEHKHTSLTSRGGSVFHRSVRSASSRLASSSSSTGSGSGRRGSRPISRGTGSGLDSKLLPDVLLGGRGRFDQLPATRRYGLAIEHE